MKLLLEDLVANAIIELYKYNKTRKITSKDLQAYAEAIKQYIITTQKKVIDITISKEEFLKFKQTYQNLFIVYQDTSYIIYLLKEDIPIGEIIDQFRAYYTEEEQDYFSNPTVLQSLGIQPHKKIQEKNILVPISYLQKYGCPICGTKNIPIDNQDVIPCSNQNCHTTFYTSLESLYTLLENNSKTSKSMDIQLLKDNPQKIKKLTIETKK